MKLTNRAKKKWFEENINSFEIFFYDCIRNPRLVEYNYFGSYKNNDEYTLYSSELLNFARYIEKMDYWEIFFKFKKLSKIKNLNKKHIFKMYYDRFDKKQIYEILEV